MKIIKFVVILFVAFESAVWFFARTHRSEKAPAVRTEVVPPQKAARSRVKEVEDSNFAKSAPSAAEPEKLRSLQEFGEHLARIKNCYEMTCEFPQNDPRSYSFAVGQKLKDSLNEMAAWVSSERLVDRGVDEIAREYLVIEDGHVQEGALHLMATQPPSLENLLAILQNIIQFGYDSRLIPPTLSELQRYTDRQDRERINQALGEAMMTGAPFVAAEVSVGIAPFLNEWSLPFFKDLAQQLPEDSIYRRNLEAALAAQN